MNKNTGKKGFERKQKKDGSSNNRIVITDTRLSP